MKITKEQFDKLPQLDRIEFRQKRDYLENNKVEIGEDGGIRRIILDEE